MRVLVIKSRFFRREVRILNFWVIIFVIMKDIFKMIYIVVKEIRYKENFVF